MDKNRKFKVLVTDDEEDILVLLKFRLQFSGYEIIQATNGEETLSKVKTEKPDILILDYKLPDMDGDKIARLVKEERNIPILIFTANINFLKTAQCEAIDDFILKPFDPEDLLGKIGSLLDKYYNKV